VADNGISSILFHTITVIVAVYTCMTCAYVHLAVTDLLVGYNIHIYIHIYLLMYLYRRHFNSGNIHRRNTRAHTHKFINICISRSKLMHIFTYVSVCISAHMCIHEYTYTHSHTKNLRCSKVAYRRKDSIASHNNFRIISYMFRPTYKRPITRP
jgi:hypothetical protein